MTTRNLSFDSASVIFLRFGKDKQRVEALAEIAVELALVHQLESPQNVIGRHVELGQIVVGEVVVGAWRPGPTSTSGS